ncbi:hypothetical protein [Kangiella taiwanensis]|uniref:Uncharacterized protein n=1 Tax=Kangiella taiwanensis TaxID=1079179 RepID=A0ABP8HY98_9GAMM|nr:hypothetical protein [Kangiella taiwanensis]
MSNDMNNEQNKAAERELEKKLNKAFDDVSEETTSPQLDASIMAMAQQEVEARDSGKAKKSWWDRLKMPVSLTAALVVTVGIARFMVELGYYSPNSISEGENLAQPSDFKKVSADSMVVLSDESSELEPVASSVPASKPAPTAMAEERLSARQQSDAEAAARERDVASQAKIKKEALDAARRRQIEEQKTIAEREAELYLSNRTASESLNIADNQVVQDTIQEDQRNSGEAFVSISNVGERETPTVTGVGEVASNEPETIVVVGSRVKASDIERTEQSENRASEVAEDAINNDSGNTSTDKGQESIIEPPYLPAEEWLQQINTLLGDDKAREAKEQWVKFKQVYPDYNVEKSLYQRLESL